MRDKILEEILVPVEVGSEAKMLIAEYASHKDLIEDMDFSQYPLYALLTIMAIAKRWITVLGRKNVLDNGASYGLMDRYLLCKKFASEYRIAYKDFIKHMNNIELNNELAEIREKLILSTAIKYDNNISLMVDIFDTSSVLYGIEGIGYAR